MATTAVFKYKKYWVGNKAKKPSRPNGRTAELESGKPSHFRTLNEQIY